MKKQIATIMITLFLVFAASSANAIMVTENFSGTIDFAEAGNPFGVAESDIFAWSTTYDLSYQNELGNIVIGDDPDMKLQVTIGSRTFNEIEDVFYGPGNFGAPILTFDEHDNVIGVSLLVDDMTGNYRFRSHGDGLAFDIYSIGSDGFTDDVHLVAGTFDFNPVPVPAAVWLLGSGLFGLIGIRRKKA